MCDYLPVKYLTSVVNNPLNTQETKAHFQTSSDSFVFIAAGDVFDPRKALKDLLDLWISNRILLKGKNLIIVGPVSHSHLSSPLAKIAMANNVIFLGESFDAREIQTILRSSRAIFVPSMQETFGQVIAEAFASGCLVIARSSIMSVTEYKEFAEFIFKTDYSADSFAESIFWCNSKEVDRVALSSAAIHHFSPNRIAQELILLYKSV
jgi:glycosyltransferase involved in cell wall biosynthesis